MPYFNYSILARDAAAASWWERREFIHSWWRSYSDDVRWTPPDYGALTREIQPRNNPHLARLHAGLVRVEALYRTAVRASRQDQPVPLANIFEQPLAATLYLLDPRRMDNAAYFSLLHASNDDEALHRLLSHARETMKRFRARRALGPVGISPHLGSGVLVDSWDQWPPLHTPSNPPYLPERLAQRMDPLQTGRLYHASVPETGPRPDGPATLEPLLPVRLATDLLPLLVEATKNPTAGFPPPDELEAAFLLRWLRVERLSGWVASVDNQPVGFVLLGPDDAPVLRNANGGRRLPRRVLTAMRRPVARQGRLYFGAVAPGYRRRGIGRQLWAAALHQAREQGWHELTAGPIWLPADGHSAATAFLETGAAVPRQTYQLFERRF